MILSMPPVDCIRDHISHLVVRSVLFRRLSIMASAAKNSAGLRVKNLQLRQGVMHFQGRARHNPLRSRRCESHSRVSEALRSR
jgi:hypothetical protein